MLSPRRRRAKLATLMVRFGGRCFWCGVAVTPNGGRHVAHWPDDMATIDHVVPGSRGRRGGRPHASDNLLLACFRCNSARGDTPADEFARALVAKGVAS